MAEQQTVFGASMLETLTTGMYQDPIIIYREYIQNACDAIDQAVREGLYAEQRQGSVHLLIDRDKRYVCIEDNGAGVPAAKFRSTVGDIANSDKEAGKDKGFRGIGRLAGLAYCKRLVFTTRAAGETAVSRLECDAVQFRAMVDEKGHTAAEVLDAAFSFSAEEAKKKDAAHFFRVELYDVEREVDALLDKERIRSYLSFVAPAAYEISFYQKGMVTKHAAKYGVPLDEYRIIVNQEPLFKAYRTNYHYKDGKHDAIQDLAFKELRDADGTVLAWLWYARTGFYAALAGKDRALAGIRVRVGNIQIGDEDTLRPFYPEARFAGYVMGELHVLPSAGLRPNARRDYFNSSPQLIALEEAFREVAKEIGKLCRSGSDMNTYLNDMRKYEKEKEAFEKKSEENRFLDAVARQKAADSLKTSEKAAKVAEQKLKSIAEMAKQEDVSDMDAGLARIAGARLSIHKEELKQQPKPSASKEKAPRPQKVQNDKVRRTDNLSELSKKEKKMVDKIYRVVEKTLADDPAVAERVIAAIEDALR
ncbi:hypothetical protein HMPREF7545_0154 [Selenomonas noxia ATCC 43541]|uniref:ATP-binding protein n=1 Tax=Selenomonas noxia TaxID=135083 RepID=UPI0001BCD058|nr:ATP-binding protein [Selenomonas noxia]EFF67003.1 hypothetical protein HMPREF7545_0154 [Selenomonas noxia ATCC 43541]